MLFRSQIKGRTEDDRDLGPHVNFTHRLSCAPITEWPPCLAAVSSPRSLPLRTLYTYFVDCLPQLECVRVRAGLGLVHCCSPVPSTALRVLHWLGQKVRSGFSVMPRANPNELFGQLNGRYLASVCLGCQNRGPQTGVLQQQKGNLSQFWRMYIQGEDGGRVGFL